MSFASRILFPALSGLLFAAFHATAATAGSVEVSVTAPNGAGVADVTVNIRKIDESSPREMNKTVRNTRTGPDGKALLQLAPGVYQVLVRGRSDGSERAGVDYVRVDGTMATSRFALDALPQAVLPGQALSDLSYRLEKQLKAGDDVGLSESLTELSRIEAMHRRAEKRLIEAFGSDDIGGASLARLSEAARKTLDANLSDAKTIFDKATAFARTVAAVESRIRADEKAGIPVTDEMESDRAILRMAYLRYKVLNDHDASARLARGMLVELARKAGQMKAKVAATGREYVPNPVLKHLIDNDPEIAKAFAEGAK